MLVALVCVKLLGFKVREFFLIENGELKVENGEWRMEIDDRDPLAGGG